MTEPQSPTHRMEAGMPQPDPLSSRTASHSTTQQDAPPEKPMNGAKPKMEEEREAMDVASLRYSYIFAMTFVLNVFLWLAMSYGVARLPERDNHPVQYFAIFLCIIFVPPLIAFAIFWGISTRLRELSMNSIQRLKKNTHFVPVISIINSVLCFGFVMGWLFAVAIPEWREATWHTALSYETTVAIPSFALIDHRGVLSPTTGKDTTSCKIQGPSVPNDYNCSEHAAWTTVGGDHAFWFDALAMPKDKRSFKDLASSVTLSAYFTLVDNSSRIAGYRQPNAVSAVFFDDRLNPHQIDVCNFASMPLISAPAQYSITTTAMRVLDKHNLTNWAAGRPACNRTVYDIFYNRSKPLSLYSLSVDSSTVYTDCEAQDADGDGTNKCQFFAEFSLGSQLVQSSHSAPGATKLSIVVNAGAIVGGVQFLMWFLEKLGG